MSDTFATAQPGLSSPATKIAAITAHDSNELAFVTRGIQVKTTAGLVRVVTVDGFEDEFYCDKGQIFPIRAKIVKSTGTTAIGLVALA